MFALARRYQRLLRMCTVASTASPDSLMGALCYDSEGCCDENAKTQRGDGESDAVAAVASSTAVSPEAAAAHS